MYHRASYTKATHKTPIARRDSKRQEISEVWPGAVVQVAGTSFVLLDLRLVAACCATRRIIGCDDQVVQTHGAEEVL